MKLKNGNFIELITTYTGNFIKLYWNQMVCRKGN